MSDIVSLIEEAWPDLRVEKEIGQGSNSRVYSADIRDAAEKGGVAVKAVVIPDDWERMDNLQAQGYSDDEIESYLESRVQKCLSETQCMLKLRDCPHVVQIEDCKVLHPQRFQWFVLIRMERLTPLVKAVARGQLSPSRVGLELCDALHFCHSKRILHRDIKPSNIFVDKDRTCKLGDFSISKKFDLSEGTVTSVGTPQFMAPEVYKALNETTSYENAVRTDLYSLGLVLYWLLNKCTMPFLTSERIATQDEKQKAFERRISGEPLPLLPQVDPAIMAVIRKAANPIPEKRYKSAAEMKAALLAAAGKAQVEEKSRHTHRRLLTAGLCALLIALIVFTGWFFFRPAPLPKNLNLPLHVEKDYINVIFLYPTQLTDRRSLALSQAQFDSAIEENWERWGVRDSAEVRRYLQKIIDKNFCAMQADLRAELVAYFTDANEDYSEFTEAYTKLGMPLFAFSSTEDETIYSEWTALMKWVHP